MANKIGKDTWLDSTYINITKSIQFEEEYLVSDSHILRINCVSITTKLNTKIPGGVTHVVDSDIMIYE